MHQYFVDKAAPGNDWALSGTHTIKMDYLTNVADEVKYYSVAANEATMVSNGYYDIALTENGFYNSNQLFKSVVKNENWTSGVNNTTEEFKDKLGRVVLKRNYESSVKHDTYYVYDQFGNLTYVIPPLVNTLDTVDLTILDGLCYQYRYDDRNRLVEKKLPGKDWEFIVYDKLNRIVATGPAYSPFIEIANNKGWLISKYDIFNRSVLTAWVDVGGILDSATRKTLQQEHDGRTVFSEGKSTADVNVNNIRFRYTNLAHPTTGYNVLTVNYYDDYNYTNAPTGFTTTIEGEPIFYNNSTAKPKGMPTGSWVRVLESLSSTNRNLTYSLYDKYARPIHTRTNTYLTGYNRVDTKFSFSGRTDYTVTRHKRISADVEMVIRDVYTYSEQDRIVTHLHRINNAPYQLMARNEYTELGQLIGKKTGGTSTTAATFYQNTSYKYNVRGWLTGINDTANLTQGSDPVDLFAFKINYNTIQQLVQGFVPGIEPLYNGNISETYWRTASDNVLRKYSYKYDKMNRLRSAHYQKPNNSVIVTDSYNESMTYDKNGNIMTLHRNGEYDDSFTALEIDDLDYAYNPEKPNELKKVTDGTNNPNGFNDDSDGTNDSADDYEYDGNGNLTSDQNKQIISISYNHLNLPVRIRFAAGSIDYLYDATGTKLRKTVTEQQNVTVTEYLGGFQYLNAKLDFFGTAQGFVKNMIRNEVNYYFYVFNFTDHLGNVRLSYGIDPDTGQLGILEENNYYAYGLKHKNYNLTTKEYKALEDGISLENCDTCPGVKYKYNGQEWQDELGLNMYDMPFRDYDPAIGRWIVIDPVIHYNVSPYAAFDNNPVYWADPSGASSENDGKTDMWGRNRFDRFGMYIPYGERGEINVSMGFEEESDFGGGGINVVVIDGNCVPTDAALQNNLEAIAALDSSVLIIMAKNTQDFYEQLSSGLNGNKISNLTFLSHGDYKNTGIYIGSDYLSKKSEFISLGKKLKPFMASNGVIALTACHVGAGIRPSSSNAMLQGLSDSSGVSVIANMTWGKASTTRFNNSNSSYWFSSPDYANFSTIPIARKTVSQNMPNAVNNLGNWLLLKPNQPSMIIQNIYFSSNGSIKF